jgi:hypothetical protein
MNKVIITIASIILASSVAYAAESINPLTGHPMKSFVITQKSDSKTPVPGNMQNPYIPAPAYQPQYQSMLPPPSQQTQEKDKVKVLDPEERYVIDGIVNDNVVLIDLLNVDRYMQVDNMTVLDNGCLVKFPSILCGNEAKKALKLNADKDELSHRVLALSKENTAVKLKLAESNHKITTQFKNINSYETKIKQLELKSSSYDIVNNQLATTTATATKNDLELAKLRTQLAESAKAISEQHKTELELKTLRKANTDATATIKSIEPKLAQATTDLKSYKTETKEAMADLSMLTNIIYKTSIGTDYNIPKLGKFKGVLHDNLIFAFVPIESKVKADAYMKTTMLRAYKSDKYILYINSKKLVED